MNTSEQAQFARLRLQCDLLLAAISPSDYAAIQSRMVQISELPDDAALVEGKDNGS